jgi:hypothetical protein
MFDDVFRAGGTLTGDPEIENYLTIMDRDPP